MATRSYVEHVTLHSSDIDRLVQRGRRLRSDAIAQSFQTTLRRLGGLRLVGGERS